MKKVNRKRYLIRRLSVAVLVVAIIVTYMPGAAFAQAPTDSPSSPITESDVGDTADPGNYINNYLTANMNNLYDFNFYSAAGYGGLWKINGQLIDLIHYLKSFNDANPEYDWGANNPEQKIEELYGLYKDYYNALDTYLANLTEVIDKRAVYDAAVSDFATGLKSSLNDSDNYQPTSISPNASSGSPAALAFGSKIFNGYLWFNNNAGVITDIDPVLGDAVRASFPSPFDIAVLNTKLNDVLDESIRETIFGVVIKDEAIDVAEAIIAAGSSPITANGIIKFPDSTPIDLSSTTNWVSFSYEIKYKAPSDVIAKAQAVINANKVITDARIAMNALDRTVPGSVAEYVLAAFDEFGSDSIYAQVRDAIEDATTDASKPTPPKEQTPPPPGNIIPPPSNNITPPPMVTTTPAAVPNVAKIRTPLKTVYLTKKKTYNIPYVLDTLNGKPIKDSKLTIKSSKPKVVKVSKSGTTLKVKALKTGKASITIKAQNGKYVKIKIVVQKKPVLLKKFKASAPKKLKMSKGKTYQIKISKLTKKASNITTVTFKSSNKKVATVDKAGKITAKKKGKVKITIKVGNKKVAKRITVR